MMNQQEKPTYDDLTQKLQEVFEQNEKEFGKEYVNVEMHEHGWTVQCMYMNRVSGNSVREAIGYGFQLDEIRRERFCLEFDFTYWGEVDV